MTKDFETKFMNLAFNLARKNIGLTGKNPSVGCVIVHNSQIIATGVTDQNGRPHAEKIAIDKVSNKKILEEATLYVTLEPCISNTGYSCCNYIIEHKIPRVAIGMSDPNKAINNKSIAKLKSAGILVKNNMLQEKAEKINEFFSHSQKQQKPFITLKLATSLDSKIATKTHDSQWITGENARKYGHHLRATHDGILIGANSLRIDDPQLNCRIAGLKDYSPAIFILSYSCNFDKNLKIFAANNNQKIYIITPLNDREKLQQIKEFSKNIEFIQLSNQENYLTRIHQLGFKSILVEGGSQVATDLIKKNQIDRLVWIRNKKIIGNDGLAAISNLQISKIDNCINNFKISKRKKLGDDLVEIFDKI